MIKEARKNLMLALVMSAAVWMGIRYRQGLYFMIGLTVLFLICILGNPAYLLYLFLLIFWIPQGFNYLFLNDLLSGANLAEAFIYIVFLLYIFTTALKKGGSGVRGILRAPLAGFLLLFFLGGFISYLVSRPEDNSFAYALFRKSVFYGPIVYILTLNLVKSEDSARKILGVLITGCCIFSAFIFYKFFFGANLVGADSGERLGGYFMLYGNSTLSVTCMAIAGQVTLVSPLAVSFSFLSNRKSYRLLGFLSFFILLSVLLATLTRSGWVAILVGITVLVFLSAKFSDRFLNARTMALILILTVVVVATVSYTLRLNDYLFYRFQSLKYSLGDTSLLDRIDIWRRSLGAFFSQPLGMGFRALYNLGGISAYPHSIYLGSLLTCGFLGALGFFGFIFAWAKNVFACLRHETSSQMKMVFIGSLGALAALLFYGVFEDTMFMPDIVMVPAWVIFGVSAAFFGRKAGNETQHGT